MNDPFRRGLHALCLRLYFDRVRCIEPGRLPSCGPALYLGLHRNGALDGLAYRRFIPSAEFMISRQLTRTAFSRMFFHGIEVARDACEGERSGNREALRACVTHLNRGGALFVFPEGTSSLGPRHLPFRAGAASILADRLAEEGCRGLQVIPLAIGYDDPTRFRSGVEVIAGLPMSLPDPSGMDRPALRAELMRRIEAALEEVGVNVSSESRMQAIHALAAIRCASGAELSHHATMKRLEREIDPMLESALAAFEARSAGKPLRRVAGFAAFPSRPFRSAITALLLSVIVFPAVIANAPPLAAGYAASRRFADGPNVVSLWRVLVGVPVFLVWLFALAAAAAIGSRLPLFLLYASLTFAGLKAFAPWRRTVAESLNRLRFPGLHGDFLELRQTVLERLP